MTEEAKERDRIKRDRIYLRTNEASDYSLSSTWRKRWTNLVGLKKGDYTKQMIVGIDSIKLRKYDLVVRRVRRVMEEDKRQPYFQEVEEEKEKGYSSSLQSSSNFDDKKGDN